MPDKKSKKDLTAGLRKNTRDMTTANKSPNPHANISAPSLSSENQKRISQNAKKKVGRPKEKTEPEKTINISVPVSVLEKMHIAKLKYQNNLTKYVNAVIKADLDKNFEKYLDLQKILNS